MPEVTLNNLIQISRPFSAETTFNDSFVFSDDPSETDLVAVLDGVSFQLPPTASTNTIPIGATTELNGTVFSLSNIFSFSGEFTQIDPTTGESFTQNAFTLALVLQDRDGNTVSFLSPASLSGGESWQPGPITSIRVGSEPFSEGQIGLNPGTEDNKLGEDLGVQIPCFVAGTLIDTASGRKPVEALQPGDMVLTRDHGYLPLAWVGQRHVSAAQIADVTDFAPVLIKAGALGLNQPERDTRVSPSHRVLVCGPRAELLFGETEVLVPAGHLVGQPGITRDFDAVTYVHIMFEQHQIVLGDGMWSESFQPADHALDGLGAEQRDEIFALFPALADQPARAAYATARMTLKAHETRLLFAA
ncbi:MAG: Hint domain-containing protein [Roseinatronobacter sp.]